MKKKSMLHLISQTNNHATAPKKTEKTPHRNIDSGQPVPASGTKAKKQKKKNSPPSLCVTVPIFEIPAFTRMEGRGFQRTQKKTTARTIKSRAVFFFSYRERKKKVSF